MKPVRPTTETGRLAEEAVARHLQAQGASVLARNYRAGRAEIDLICREGETVVFVEVKYRSRSDFGHPEETLSEAQQARILEAADVWLEDHDCQSPIRFDVFSVSGPPEAFSLRRFPDAFF